MMQIRKFFIAAMVFLVCGFGLAQASTPFPDLIDLDGQPAGEQAEVGDGKWKLVMIWATDCHVCQEQKPLISAFHEAHKEVDAQVYGIALDGPDSLPVVAKYMKDHDVKFPTFVGEPALIFANYEINLKEPFYGTPSYVLFKPNGELAAAQAGIISIEGLESYIAANSATTDGEGVKAVAEEAAR